MMDYTREQKLAHARNLVASGDWAWCKSEFQAIVKLRRLNVNSVMDNNTIFRAGVLAGMEYCLEYPDLAFKTNQKFFDRMMDKIMGEPKKVEEIEP